MRDGRWPWALIPIALTCVTSQGHAASQALDLEYDADSTCPSQEDFSALVLEKLAASGIDAGGVRPQIAAHLQSASSGFVGKLTLRRSDASSYEREVTGASCAEVANALAFVLALALGAKDTAAASTESASPAKVAPPAPPAVPPVAPPPVTSRAPTQMPELAVEERHSPWRLGAGGQVGTRGGLGASTLSVVGSAFLEARRIAVSPFGFALRLAFSSAQTARHEDSNGTTDFSWSAGKLEACPLRLKVWQPLALLPCAGADVGRLQASGSPISAPGSSGEKTSKLWIDGVVGARLELSLADWLALEVQGNLIVPFIRYRFEFRTDTAVSRVPALALDAFAGLAAHFP